MKFSLVAYARAQKAARFMVYLFTPETSLLGMVVVVFTVLYIGTDSANMLSMDELVFPSEVELEAVAYFGPDAMNPAPQTPVVSGSTGLSASGALR